jgi:hypothetical protein
VIWYQLICIASSYADAFTVVAVVVVVVVVALLGTGSRNCLYRCVLMSLNVKLAFLGEPAGGGMALTLLERISA